MNNINRILLNMALVEARAKELNCTVIAVLNNVILCYRGDDSYITWKCYVQRNTDNKNNLEVTYRAVFDSGDYDMTLEAGRASLMSRANWGRIFRDVIESSESLCLDDETDRETLIHNLIGAKAI